MYYILLHTSHTIALQYRTLGHITLHYYVSSIHERVFFALISNLKCGECKEPLLKPLQKELAKRQFRVALQRDSKLFSTPSQLSRTEKALAINRSRNSAEPVVRGMGGECFYWRRVVVNWGVLLIEGELLLIGGVAVKGEVVVQLAGGRGWCSILGLAACAGLCAPFTLSPGSSLPQK